MCVLPLVCASSINTVQMISPVFVLATLIISPGESQGFIGFRSVVSPPLKFPCVRDNSKRIKIFLSNLVHMLRITKRSLFSGVLKLPRFKNLRARERKYNILNTPFFMIVMHPSSGYTILLSKIKILSINMINSYISVIQKIGNTRSMHVAWVRTCRDIMTPKSCYLKLFFSKST